MELVAGPDGRWYFGAAEASYWMIPGTRQKVRNPYSVAARRRTKAIAKQSNANSIARDRCYFIGGKSGPIKIGFTLDLARRLRQVQAHCPGRVAVLASIPGGRAEEAAYHLQFSKWRLHGEWFDRSRPIMSEIARLNRLSA